MNTNEYYNRAIHSIDTGNYGAFFNVVRHVPIRRRLDLLLHASSRPDSAGLDMSLSLLSDLHDIPRDLYLAVCKNAINYGHVERVCTLANKARFHVKDFDDSFYIEIVNAALPEHKEIADTVKRYCEYILTWGAGPAITYI